DLVQMLLLADADAEALAVVGDDLELGYAVRHARPRAVELGLDGVDAAGVVADVAADRAARVRRGVRPEDQPGLLAGLLVDLLVDRARLAADPAPLPVDVADPG